MALFDLLGNDELPGGGLSINVLFFLSIDLLVGFLELFRLVFYIFQQTGVVCECILECALTEDTPIGTDVDYEVCDWADHCDVVGLYDTLTRCRVHRDVSLAYHQNDSASTQEVTVETFVDDPAGSVNIKGSQNLPVGALDRTGEQ